MRHRLSFLALVAIVASSGVTVAVAKTRKRAAARKPLTIPATKQKPAKWVSAPPDKQPRFYPVAYDKTLALAASPDAPTTLLAYTDKNGVEGPIVLPKQTTWIGTGKGTIFAATDDGTLYRADTLAAARKDGLTKVIQVKGATTWDAGGGALIVAVGKRVSVSTDGGATFHHTDFEADITSVFARGDGVLVAVPQDSWAWVSTDGRVWQEPIGSLDPAQQKPVGCEGAGSGLGGGWGDDGDGDSANDGADRPNKICLRPTAPRFQRDGDLIVAYGEYGGRGSGGCYDGWCVVEYNCMQGALATDGKTWVEPGAQPHYYNRAATPFDPLQRMDGASLPVTAAPAARGKSAALATKECLADPSSLDDRSGTAIGGGYNDCRGLGCLRFASQPADDGTHSFFTDAACPDDNTTCSRPATRLSIGAKGQIVLSRAPCGPGWLASSHGIALLECPTSIKSGGGSEAIYLGDRAGNWHPQDDLPISQGVRIDVADDGTILASEICTPGNPCRAFVRAPQSLETRAAWTEVTQPGVLAYRVVAGGRALAVVGASKRKATPVKVGMGGYDSKPVFSGSYYDAFSTSYGEHPLEPIVQTCITDAVGRMGPMTGVVTVTAALDVNGTLLAVSVKDAPDAAARDCIIAAGNKLTYRKPPGAVVSSRFVGYEAADLSYALWLLDGSSGSGGSSGKPVVIADNLDAKDGLRDVNVDGTKIEVLVGEREYGARRGVLTTDGTIIEKK